MHRDGVLKLRICPRQGPSERLPHLPDAQQEFGVRVRIPKQFLL